MTGRRQICPWGASGTRGTSAPSEGLKGCHTEPCAAAIGPAVYVLLHSALSNAVLHQPWVLHQDIIQASHDIYQCPPPPFYIKISCSIGIKNFQSMKKRRLQRSLSGLPVVLPSLPSPVLFPVHHHNVLYRKFPQCWLLKASPIIYQMNNFMEQVIRSLLSW